MRDPLMSSWPSCKRRMNKLQVPAEGGPSIPDDLPEWAIKLARRLTALPAGRHVLILTTVEDRHDLTILPAGKVEELS